MSLNTTPRTWTAAEVITAAEMNTEIRDAVTGIQAAWTAYTPAWTSTGTAPAIGNGAIVGAYLQIGKTIKFRVVITAGSTTTFGTGTYTISLPFTTGGAGRLEAGGLARDDSAAADYSICAIIAASTTTAPLRTLPTTAGNALVGVSPTVPFTLATLDSLSVEGEYEAA